MKKIRNLRELAEAVGTEPNIKSISASIYRGTACGAWVDERDIVTKRPTRFKVKFGESPIYGLVAHNWQYQSRRRGFDSAWHGFSMAPPELREYIGGPEPKFVGPYEFDWRNMLKVDSDLKTLAELKQEQAKNEAAMGDWFKQLLPRIEWLPRKWDTAYITVDLASHKPGIGIGSIVEGIDECAQTMELEYPFTDRDFWTAVQDVEDDVRRIWNDTHGCERCWIGEGPLEENPEAQFELRSVDPECIACKGEGEAI